MGWVWKKLRNFSEYDCSIEVLVKFLKINNCNQKIFVNTLVKNQRRWTEEFFCTSYNAVFLNDLKKGLIEDVIPMVGLNGHFFLLDPNELYNRSK